MDDFGNLLHWSDFHMWQSSMCTLGFFEGTLLEFVFAQTEDV